jgi:peroxiredoxin
MRRPITTRFTLAAAGVWLASSLASGAGASVPERPAPACTLAPLGSGDALELRQLRGRVVYVDFWASWCTACASAFPSINALHRDLGGRGLEVLGITVDEEPADALAFLRDHPARFDVAADPRGDCAEAFGVQVMPSGFLIDRKGLVRFVVRGFSQRDAEEVRRMAERLLAEPIGA